MKNRKRIFWWTLSLPLAASIWLAINALLPVHVPATNPSTPLLFAHRGQRDMHPGNSAAAFTASWKLGFTAVEVDIRLTKDNVPILFHDDEGSRLLHLPKTIRELPWDSINDRTLYFQGVETKQEILTLDDFLKILPANHMVYLDIKDANGTMLNLLISKLRLHPKASQFILASSNWWFLTQAKAKIPKASVCLEGFNKGKEWLYYVLPKPYHPDFFSSYLNQVDHAHIDFLKDKNLMDRRIAYGVNATNWKDATTLGIQHLILDYTSDMPPLASMTDSLKNEAEEK